MQSAGDEGTIKEEEDEEEEEEAEIGEGKNIRVEQKKRGKKENIRDECRDEERWKAKREDTIRGRKERIVEDR